MAPRRRRTRRPRSINTDTFICSGAVIAPRIVLTAGHCVVDASSWTVVAPYASKQSATGSKSWTDYVATGESVNPATLDVAVIILDKPITLSSYPKLASSPSAAGTQAVNVGRIRNGQASFTGLVLRQRGDAAVGLFVWLSQGVHLVGDHRGR